MPAQLFNNSSQTDTVKTLADILLISKLPRHHRKPSPYFRSKLRKDLEFFQCRSTRIIKS